jgi:hypothetical protein
MSERTPSHRGTTTGPIAVRALLERLRRERIDTQRAAIGLPALRRSAATAPPVLKYTRPAAWHLALVVVVALVAFSTTFLVAVWVDRPHGYARPVAPRTGQVSVPAPPPSSAAR